MSQHAHVNGDREQFVERVEADAASMRIIDRIRQQMVEIYEEACEHEQEVLEPDFRIKRHRQQQRNQEMQKDVNRHNSFVQTVANVKMTTIISAAGDSNRT
jgi:CRISPR/Cas system type I-B associated protein Csh2 (Cas7 group RAMP superfamily)